MTDRSIFRGRIPTCGTICMTDVLEDALDCESYREQSCFCQPGALEALRSDATRVEEAFECLYAECDMSGRQVDYRDVEAACDVFNSEQSTAATGQPSATETTPTTTIIAPDPSLVPQSEIADEIDTDDNGGISLGAKVAIPAGIVIAIGVLVGFLFRHYIRRWVGRVAGSGSANDPKMQAMANAELEGGISMTDIREDTRDDPHMPELSGRGLTGHDIGPELAGSRPTGHDVGPELAGSRPSGHDTGAAEMGVDHPQIAEMDGTGLGDTLPRREAGKTLPRPEAGESEGGAKVFTI